MNHAASILERERILLTREVKDLEEYTELFPEGQHHKFRLENAKRRLSEVELTLKLIQEYESGNETGYTAITTVGQVVREPYSPGSHS